MARKRKELTVEIKPPVQDGIVSIQSSSSVLVQASTSSSSRRTAGPAGFLIQHYGDRLYATEPTQCRA